MIRIKLDAYEKEVMQFAKEIVFYLQKSGVSSSLAQDISQDVLVKILECHYVLPKEKLRAWMYRVALRRYIDLYRREKSYQDLLQDDFFKQDEKLPFDQVDYAPLYQALALLKEQYRVVLDLHYFQGFSIKEIAQILGLSVSNVKVTLMRGRKQLRQLLEREGYDNDDFK